VAAGGQQHPRARDALEAIHPAAAETDALDALVDGDCRQLVWAAAGELASIPAGNEPAGLSLALVHLAAAEHETGGRFLLWAPLPLMSSCGRHPDRFARSCGKSPLWMARLLQRVACLRGPGESRSGGSSPAG